MSNSGEDLVATYTPSELEVLEADCETALPIGSEHNLLIEEFGMGRKAKARRRAARQAAATEISTISLDETDCEIPIVKTSKIPVLQKGYQISPAEKSGKSPTSSTSSSKIPRPTGAQLVYLKPMESDSEPTSYTPTAGSFTNTTMVTGSEHGTRVNVSPLPKCDLSSEIEGKTPIAPAATKMADANSVVVVAEANGVEMSMDMTAMLHTLDLDLVGLRFL